MSVGDGDVVALLGANGAGKTTTLRAITGGVRWDGIINFAGRSLHRATTETIVRMGIAHVPEGRGVLTELTVEENLRLGAYLRRDGDGITKDYDRVFGYFPILRERRKLSASTLSGGEQQVLSGIAAGGIYASLALALVLIYNAMGLVNFAQGEMAMFATFLAFTLIGHGISYWIALPVTIAIAFIGGIVIQRIVIRPVERAPVLTLVIVTLGLATLINGLAGFFFGYLPRSFPSPFSVQTVDILGAAASWQDLGVMAVSGVVLVLVFFMLQRTSVGLAMRAAAHNPEASRLLGIRVSWMLALGWGLASAVGAVSGIMVAPILDPE